MSTWRVLRWDNKPEVVSSIPFTCPQCRLSADVPCGQLIGGSLIAMTPDNWLVFDPPCYEPEENWLPTEIQCRKCGGILDELQRHGVALIATSQGIDTSNENPAGRLQLNVLIVVAQFEREIIRDRVNSGIAAAKKRGVRFGRPRKHFHTTADLTALQAEGLGVRAISRKLKMPVSSVSIILKAARGPANGGKREAAEPPAPESQCAAV